MKKTLRLILGDQLNSKHSWFKTVDESVTYVMMEIVRKQIMLHIIFKK
jgi:deoxyribodipyrimidine photolyase-related protein